MRLSYASDSDWGHRLGEADTHINLCAVIASDVLAKDLRKIISGLFLNCLFLRQHKVEQDGKEEDYSNTVIGKDSAHNVREDVKHACCLGESETDAERETDDDHVAL